MQVHYKNFGAKTSLRCGFLEGDYTFPEHIHQYPEIVFVEDGELEITVDGEAEKMRCGDFAIVPPFKTHSFRTEKYVRRWICVFSDDFMKSILSEEQYYGSGKQCVFHASDELLAYVSDKLYDSGELFFEMSEEQILTFKAMLFAIYEEYIRKSGTTDKKRSNKALSSILLYISEHCTENLSLSTIGAALGYSRKYVSLCLTDIEGMNLFWLINSFRADIAKSLLATTKKTMLDIAIECGYTSERSFLRAFKQVTDTTPGEYRKRKRTPTANENEIAHYPRIYELREERAKKAKELKG